jgi:hypothetical protein
MKTPALSCPGYSSCTPACNYFVTSSSEQENFEAYQADYRSALLPDLPTRDESGSPWGSPETPKRPKAVRPAISTSFSSGTLKPINEYGEPLDITVKPHRGNRLDSNPISPETKATSVAASKWISPFNPENASQHSQSDADLSDSDVSPLVLKTRETRLVRDPSSPVARRSRPFGPGPRRQTSIGGANRPALSIRTTANPYPSEVSSHNLTETPNLKPKPKRMEWRFDPVQRGEQMAGPTPQRLKELLKEADDIRAGLTAQSSLYGSDAGSHSVPETVTMRLRFAAATARRATLSGSQMTPLLLPLVSSTPSTGESQGARTRAQSMALTGGPSEGSTRGGRPSRARASTFPTLPGRSTFTGGRSGLVNSVSAAGLTAAGENNVKESYASVFYPDSDDEVSKTSQTFYDAINVMLGPDPSPYDTAALIRRGL